MRMFNLIYNFILGVKYGKHIKCEGDGKLRAEPRLSHFIFGKNATMKLQGLMVIGANSFKYNGRSNIFRLDDNAVIKVLGKFSFMYGADVIVFSGGVLELGDSSFINSDCKIRCHEHISVGKKCAISHDVTIMDSDAHALNGDRHKAPVIIGDHVWVGTRVTILSGTTIGENCVIAAGSVVKGVYPPNTLIAGVPAKVIKTDIQWSK